jgi:hypothetical protein
VAQGNGGYWNKSFTLIFIGQHLWPKGMGVTGMDLLLSFSLANIYGPREWEAVGMEFYSHSDRLTPVAHGNGGLLEWTCYSYSRWPTLIAQGNRRLLECRASTPMDSLDQTRLVSFRTEGLASIA